jgi:hypothetical protein
MGPIHHVSFDVIELERWFLAWQPCPEVEIGGNCRDSVVWRYYADPCKDSQCSVVSQVRFDKSARQRRGVYKSVWLFRLRWKCQRLVRGG